MPIRRRHVRRTVLAALFLFIFVPLVALALYGWWVRSGGLAPGLEAHLAQRLRAESVRVAGLRPTGRDSVVADRLELAWDTGAGTIRAGLADLEASRDAATGRWRVKAGHGAVDVAATDLSATLRAWNQRLVQMEADLPIERLDVAAVAATVRSDRLKARAAVALAAEADGEARLAIAFAPVETEDAAWEGSAHLPLIPLAGMAVFDGASRAEAFTSFQGRAGGLAPGTVARALLALDLPADTQGEADIALDWPAASAEAVEVRVSGLDLAQLGRAMPGGPPADGADLRVAWGEAEPGRGQRLRIDLVGDGPGIVPVEGLEYLATFLPVAVPAPLFSGRVGYDRLAASVEVDGAGRGRFVTDGSPGLVWTRLFGLDLPLLSALPDAFDARAAWTDHLRPLLVGASGGTR